MERRTIRHLSAVSAALLACVIAFGCGGGGGSGDGGGNGGVIDPGVNYLATFFGDSSGDVGMEAGDSSGEDFDVRIVVNNIDKLFGAAFHVTFDSSVAEFVGLSALNEVESILGADADFQAGLVSLGELAVSATMTGTQAGLDDATGRLIILSFRATAATTGSDFTFEPEDARLVKICPTANAPCTNTVPGNWTEGSLMAVAD